MPTIDDCIRQAIADGKLSVKGAEEYRKRMADAEREAAQRGLAGADAHIFATTKAAEAMERNAKGRRAQVRQTILSVDRAWEGASKNRRGVGYGLTDVLGQHVAAEGSGASIGQMRLGNMGAMQDILSDFLANIQSKTAGLRHNRILPQHVVSALYGERVSDPVAEASAKAWNEALKWWRDQMARSAIVVRNLDDWRLPQHWDKQRVRNVGRDGFIAQMDRWWRDGNLRLRDWELDGDANLVPGVDDDKALGIFDRAFLNITSEGDASLEPGAVRNHSLADRYGRRRVFDWATDGAWREFNRTFGVGDAMIGELMTRHVDHITRDLALAQVLGPDPARAKDILLQMYRRQEAGKTFTRVWSRTLENIYDIQSGAAQTPASQRFALVMQSIRSWLAASQLGGAVLSATSDFAFTKATAGWHGLSMTRVMGDYLARIGPGSVEGRAEAMRSGLILEVGLHGMHDAARDVINDMVVRQGASGKLDATLNGLAAISGRAAEVVMRAQGLSHHTQIMRDAIGMQLQAKLADIAGKSLDQLDAIDRRLFAEYGISAKDWDLLRAKSVHNGFLDPTRLSRDGDAAERNAAIKMIGAIGLIQRSAVPEANVVTRALIMGGTQPGSVVGETMRSIAQYKGFPMGAFLMHFFRGLDSLSDAEGQWFRGQYLAGLLVGTTVLGAAALQLKNVAAGKDPEPMDRAKFWAQAAAQGGALGIIGDQIRAVYGAQRIGDAARVMTPTGGLLLDIAGLGFGNIQDNLADREMHAGREAVRFANKYTPDVWYTRLAMDRMVWDTLTKWSDPNAATSFARMIERARKEQETQYYWPPGRSAPERFPVAR